VTFERLSPTERVAVAEAHLAQLELPGSPRLGVETLARQRILKVALADDEASDERFVELLAAWREHLDTLDPDAANEARDALTEFGRIVDGLRGPAGQEEDA
jgi:hypothetical protein